MIFIVYINIKSQSNRRFPYGYLVTTSLQLLNIFWASSFNFLIKFYVNKKVKETKQKDFQYIQLPECDGRGVQGSGTYSPWRADPRLLVIPASCFRIAENNLNWGKI